MLIGNDWYLRAMPAGRLKELLAYMPDEYWVSINSVGNIVGISREIHEKLTEGRVDFLYPMTVINISGETIEHYGSN